MSLEVGVLRRARALAVREGTSISALVARRIADMVTEDEAYERSRRIALHLLEAGIPLGGKIVASRDAWHER